jgi:hypothetical protein
MIGENFLPELMKSINHRFRISNKFQAGERKRKSQLDTLKPNHTTPKTRIKP